MGQIHYTYAADGVQIAYVTMGSGTPVVVMPGVLSHAPLEWHVAHSHIFRILAERHRLISYEHRGQGLSERNPEDVSLDGFTRDIKAVLDEVEPGPVALLARAYSGPVAISFAAQYPDRVSDLFLFNTYARGSVFFDTPLSQALLPLVDRDWDLFSIASRQAMSHWMTAEEASSRAQAFRDSMSPEFYLRLYRERKSFDGSKWVSRVQAPTVVFHHSNSTLVNETAGSLLLAASIANARLIMIPDVADMATEIQQLCDEVTNTVTNSATERKKPKPRSDAYSIELSPRELQTLRLLAQGKRNKEIADELSLSVHTVERHVANIYSKINVQSRVEAANYATQRNLLG